MSKIRIAVHGAAGRMGQRIVALGSEDPRISIVAAIDQGGHPQQDRDVGTLAGVAPLGITLGTKLDAEADVVIDFSVPVGTETILSVCESRGIPIVVATTGLNAGQEAAVKDASQKIPVLYSPSMSLAVNLTMRLAEIAARSLSDHPTGADVEIIERHHRFKEDAPSGTALRFGQLIAAQMGQAKAVHGREGRPGKRTHSEIGYHAVRCGDNPGEHTIVFGLLGESIELTVRATNRDCYAQGALAAAKFLHGKPPGLYGMQHVLGLD
jgi:4-hydroxy-tetrahydrodipicolinate reductase